MMRLPLMVTGCLLVASSAFAQSGVRVQEVAPTAPVEVVPVVPVERPPSNTGMAPNPHDVRGASQSKTDPETIGTSGRDKQTGATKDKD